MWTSMIPFSKMLEKDHGEILSQKRRVEGSRAPECDLHQHRAWPLLLCFPYLGKRSHEKDCAMRFSASVHLSFAND